MHEILPWFKTVAAPEGERFVSSDPADDSFVWCALAGGAAIIVSDDRLLACNNCPVPVLTPGSFLEKLEQV